MRAQAASRRDNGRSDALVLFGITGDLAYQKVIPALQAMVRAKDLDVPVVGVARSGWSRETAPRADARRASTITAGVDEAAFAKLTSLFEYVDGDYTDPGTFARLREALGGAERPLHYLAIPPALFEEVIEHIEGAGCATNARVVIEKPFGRDLASRASAQRGASARVPRGRDLPDRSLPRARSRSRTSRTSGSRTRSSSRSGTATTWTACRSRWPRSSACASAARSTTTVGAIRDVVQNHLLQVLALVAMEPPSGFDRDVFLTERIRLLQAIRPLEAERCDPRPVRRVSRPAGRGSATRRSRPTSRCGCRSRRGDGRACRSTSGRASGWRSPPPRCSWS